MSFSKSYTPWNKGLRDGDYDWSDLEELYWGQKLSIYEVADLKQCHPSRVARAMWELNIPWRNHSEAVKLAIKKHRFKPPSNEGSKNSRYGEHLSDQTKQLIAASWTVERREAAARIMRRIGQMFSGAKHSNWKGGIGNEPYLLEFSWELKERIRERDGRKCQKCGVPECECVRLLSIHHIDYDKDNLDETNLISLCNSCNGKVNFNREYWQMYFTLKLYHGKKLLAVSGSGVERITANEEKAESLLLVAT